MYIYTYIYLKFNYNFKFKFIIENVICNYMYVSFSNTSSDIRETFLNEISILVEFIARFCVAPLFFLKFQKLLVLGQKLLSLFHLVTRA